MHRDSFEKLYLYLKCLAIQPDPIRECFCNWCKGCYIPGIGPGIINETVPHERWRSLKGEKKYVWFTDKSLLFNFLIITYLHLITYKALILRKKLNLIIYITLPWQGGLWYFLPCLIPGVLYPRYKTAGLISDMFVLSARRGIFSNISLYNAMS